MVLNVNLKVEIVKNNNKYVGKKKFFHLVEAIS